MRRALILSSATAFGGGLLLIFAAAAAAAAACSSTSNGSGFGATMDSGTIKFNPLDGGSRDSSLVNPGHDTGLLQMTTGDTGTSTEGGTIIMTSKTTIYVHTDTELYSMDPMTHALTDLGTFTGTSGGYYDSTITDLAVDAAGEIYVNTETVVYTVKLPASPGPGAQVQLTKFVDTAPGLPDGGTPAVRFYALAFAPAGAIGVSTLPTGETLVGGDSKGELWVIGSTGTPIDVGNFGTDPNVAANFLALSGDLVFYTASGEAGSVPTGLATIRSCETASPTKCTKTSDYLAAVNMANLKANAAAPGGTPKSLLGGIYGGTTTTDGNGTGKAELFGLGAWQGDVYGFSRCYECYDGGANTPPSLVSIDPATGVGTTVGNPFPFTNGWSGAGVTTKVTVTVIPPPMTAPPMAK
jgi:hypothetical protein